MAYLTKDQVKEIVKNAPDKSVIINDLVKRGHTLEGYNQSQTSSAQPQNTFGTTAGKIARAPADITSNVAKGVAKGVGSAFLGFVQTGQALGKQYLLPSLGLKGYGEITGR